MAASMAYGRNYLIGHGNRNGPVRDRKAKFRTTTPDGIRVKLTMNVRGTLEEPMIVFTDETGKWLPRTVVDNKNLPDWTKNYTLVQAVEIG